METTPAPEALGIAGRREKYFVWMVLVVTAIAYLGTARFDFVYDDVPQIVTNPFIRAWRYAPQDFAISVWKHMAPWASGNYYRPMFLLLMRTCYALFADRPLGWHLLAIAMHVVVTWLTYILLRKMTGQFTTAWLAALIFGVHPIHHEVVAWVCGTTESLFAILFLLSFLAFLRSREASKALWMSLSCALYSLALLSKETAVVLPALVFAYGWIASGSVESESHLGLTVRFQRALTPAIFYLPIALLYLAVRSRVLSGFSHPVVSLSPLTWLSTLPSILFFYVKNWFFPFRLSEFYDVYYQPNLSFTRVLLPALILIAIVAAIWILRNRLDAKAVDYSVVWIVIPILPALCTFVFAPNELVHDRYFYVPSMGAALLVALLIQRVSTSRAAFFDQPAHVVVSGLVIALILASLAGYAAGFWRSDYALFSRAHQIAPRNATASNDLAVELIGRNEVGAAQKLLETAYRENPLDFHFPLNLGRAYYGQGQYQRAEAFAERVKELEPNLPDAYVLSAQIQLKQGRGLEAQESMRNAARLNPYSATVHTIYGIVLSSNGDCTDADQQFEAALALDPSDAVTKVQMNRCRAALSPTVHPVTNPGEL